MKILVRLLIGLAAVLLIVLLGAWLTLRASLPDLSGDRPLAGLDAPVRVERDSLGVPHIKAETRADAARALGFLHAQERRFQMDLLRRAASGELAALLGEDLLSADSVLRPHLFHEKALEALGALPQRHRELLDAYASGVNAGTDALGVRPFEYLVLRQRPTPWRPEDALLVAYAMTIDLQRSDLDDDLGVYARERSLPASLVRFLDPGGDRWDAPLVGDPVAEVAPPPEDSLGQFRPAPAGDPDDGASFLSSLQSEAARVGSNNWAVAGSRTVHGSALVADDMHLGLGVPPIWYRASWTVENASGDAPRTLTGVTLPGAPLMIVGSNGDVAWGFTNSYGDYADLVRLVMEPGMTNLVQTDSGTAQITVRREMLEVAGGERVPLDIEITPWGPVMHTDGRGDRYAVQWGAHRVESSNMNLVDLEDARTLDEAFAVANTAGIPAQNFVAGDREGRIGWTIAGRIPDRGGRDGSTPVPSTDPGARWDGFLSPEAVPRVVEPEEGLVWTANARVVEGEALRLIGDGGYASGARARQIRDGLRTLTGTIVESDLHMIQLDDRALFMSRWHDLMADVLAADGSGGYRAVLRQRLSGWTGRATPEDPAYGLVKAFREEVGVRVAASMLAGPLAIHDDVGLPSENALWALATQRPAHLLPADAQSWEEVLLAAADAAGERTPETWGVENTADIEHPMADALPFVGRWLRMPAAPLAGDAWMPRVTGPAFGASQRMVVSPGQEQDGLMVLPGGQSGHPFSPYWGAGHDAWVEGRALPFLPGRPKWTLTLSPAQP